MRLRHGNSRGSWKTMPILCGEGKTIRPSKSESSPDMIRSKVVLPQPEGPSSAQISPSRKLKFTSCRTTRVCPEAVRSALRAMETSSSMRRPPTRDMPLDRLHNESFNRQHETDKGKRVGQEPRHVEQLESYADLEADAVRAA